MQLQINSGKEWLKKEHNVTTKLLLDQKYAVKGKKEKMDALNQRDNLSLPSVCVHVWVGIFRFFPYGTHACFHPLVK